MHAYLIIAHKCPDQIKMLLSQIDDERNDIYLLFDKKSDVMKLTTYDYDLKYSKLHFVSPLKINWGGYSQIKAEMSLLEAVVKEKDYEYLHLISGQDLLIKSQDQVHQFFLEHKGEEFLNVAKDNQETKDIIRKNTRYYYYFQEIVRKKTINPIRLFFKVLQKLLLGIQKLFKVDRHKKDNITFHKGANWFSITGEFAKYVVDKKEYIHKLFSRSLCCDEIFLHTLFFNSEFKSHLAELRIREIDWARGKNASPYTYRIGDLDLLKNSPKIFARKFDLKVDKDIVSEVIKFTK